MKLKQLWVQKLDIFETPPPTSGGVCANHFSTSHISFEADGCKLKEGAIPRRIFIPNTEKILLPNSNKTKYIVESEEPEFDPLAGNLFDRICDQAFKSFCYF